MSLYGFCNNTIPILFLLFTEKYRLPNFLEASEICKQLLLKLTSEICLQNFGKLLSSSTLKMLKFPWFLAILFVFTPFSLELNFAHMTLKSLIFTIVLKVIKHF